MAGDYENFSIEAEEALLTGYRTEHTESMDAAPRKQSSPGVPQSKQPARAHSSIPIQAKTISSGLQSI